MEQKKKSRSIARQLNAELEWRKFWRQLCFSVFFAAVAVVVWCYVKEGLAGGRTFGVAAREFGGALRPNPPSTWGSALRAFPRDFLAVARRIVYGTEPQFSDYFPFRDVVYRFSLPGNGMMPVEESAGAILGAVWWVFLAVNLSGFFSALIRSAFGSRLIRRYLRPLDDMAALAEQLSEERHSVDGISVREQTRRAREQKDGGDAGDEKSGDSDLEEALGDVIGEIEEVEDSGARIEFHQTELEGLESALNNMLRRLEENRRKQIRFVDDASHELRTPIAVIHGYADMLDRWGKKDPKVLDEAVSAIKTESEHMTTLIDQLLFLARGEMDRHVLERQPVDAQALLDEIMVESEMLDGGHVFRMLSSPHEPEESPKPDASEAVTPDPGEGASGEEKPEEAPAPLTVYGDPAMLKQSVRILRDNAVKYTPAGGEVTFKAYRRTDAPDRQPKICIEVGDNGIGIPKDELPRIFDRFYRGTNARADNAGGSGLGLSIAQWIVREHGGTIEAISGSGFGTRMTIVLPEEAAEQ